MAELIETTRKQRNSIGSRVDLAIVGLPMGLGDSDHTSFGHLFLGNPLSHVLLYFLFFPLQSKQ